MCIWRLGAKGYREKENSYESSATAVKNLLMEMVEDVGLQAFQKRGSSSEYLSNGRERERES